MVEHVVGDRLDVVRYDVVPAACRGAGPRNGEQRDGGAGAYWMPVRNVLKPYCLHSVENPLQTYAGLGASWFMGVMVTS